MANLSNTKRLNAVTFFKELAESWKAANKCGNCWSFGAPLTEAGMNTQQPQSGSECCVHLILTKYRVGSTYKYNDTTKLQNYEACNHNFTLYAVVQRSDTGQNVFNEIEGHPISESLWTEVHEPLLDCLGCGREMDLCALGYDFDIISWDMEAVIFKEDQNWTGWKITGSFREKLLGN